MIKDSISDYSTVLIDGSIEAFISILFFHKGKNISFSFAKIFQNFNFKNPYDSIEKIAKDFQIVSLQCNDTSVSELKEFNYPTILNISDDASKKHFVVCFGYNHKFGFLMEDFMMGKYYLTENDLCKKWSNSACWTFIS